MRWPGSRRPRSRFALPADDDVYGYLGILYDVTAERSWELERLRPAGQLGRARPVPVDIARILDEIPPHLFPEQFASEARRIAGGPVALYVLDIDGTHLLRLAGPDDFPARVEAPLALGPELAEDGRAGAPRARGGRASGSRHGPDVAPRPRGGAAARARSRRELARRPGPPRRRGHGACQRLHGRLRGGAPPQGDPAGRRASAEPPSTAYRSDRRRRDRRQRHARL